jgi:hypothetical protein
MSNLPNQDISEFLRHRLTDIRRTTQLPHLDDDWPGDEKIGALTKSAGGLFVWASTACSSIDPKERLTELITQQLDINLSEPLAQLDRLYQTDLRSVGPWNNRSFRSDCCDI